MSQLVFIAFQANDNARYLVEAIAEKRLVINRETMEEKLGREWDVQEMLIDVISIGGNVDEDDDHFILQWT